MKKLFLFVVVAMMAAAASAQVVTSRTLVKSKSQTMWYGRVGLSLNNVAGAPSEMGAGAKAGLDVDFGFHRNIGKAGAYWGMELGVGTRGASFDIEDYDDGKISADYSAWNIKYSPVTLGYKYSLTDDIKIDGHLGAFLSYDFSKKFEIEGEDVIDDMDYLDFDAGMQIGAGIWWKRFNLDFTYQRGFVNIFDGSDDSLNSSNFEIRLGYAF